MHGIIKPLTSSDIGNGSSIGERAIGWARRNIAFVGLVLAPTLIVTAYYYLWAANQYQSEAHFVIRTTESSPAISNSFGSMLGLAGPSQTHSDVMAVSDYLESHDALEELNRRTNITALFQRPEADIISRLKREPTPEALLKYYEKHVLVKFDAEQGITILRVRAFRPEDAVVIIRNLLDLSEKRVNFLNERSRKDTLSAAEKQLGEAENGLVGIQRQLTLFRQARGDVDPAGSAKAQIGLVTTLTGALAQAKAQLNSMDGIISPSSPQYRATAARVRALEAQVNGQSARLVTGSTAIAAKLGNYEDLLVRQDFAAKRYAAAAANMEKARDQANKQQLYLVTTVSPNTPVKSEFPERGRIVLTVFFSLLIAYSIGWLIMAGVKEHSA